MPEEALVVAQKEPHAFFNLYARHFALFALDRQDEADILLKELEDTYGSVEAANMADAYAFRGEIDTAFKWLDKAVEIKDPVLLEAMNFPSFKILYSDTRWAQLIAKMNLPKDHGYPLK
jgi:tetratricopeptide (TPR) repeat protein